MDLLRLIPGLFKSKYLDEIDPVSYCRGYKPPKKEDIREIYRTMPEHDDRAMFVVDTGLRALETLTNAFYTDRHPVTKLEFTRFHRQALAMNLLEAIRYLRRTPCVPWRSFRKIKRIFHLRRLERDCRKYIDSSVHCLELLDPFRNPYDGEPTDLKPVD